MRAFRLPLNVSYIKADIIYAPEVASILSCFFESWLGGGHARARGRTGVRASEIWRPLGASGDGASGDGARGRARQRGAERAHPRALGPVPVARRAPDLHLVREAAGGAVFLGEEHLAERFGPRLSRRPRIAPQHSVPDLEVVCGEENRRGFHVFLSLLSSLEVRGLNRQGDALQEIQPEWRVLIFSVS